MYLFLRHEIRERSLCFVGFSTNSLQIWLVFIQRLRSYIVTIFLFKKKRANYEKQVALLEKNSRLLNIDMMKILKHICKTMFLLVVSINLFFHIDIPHTSCFCPSAHNWNKPSMTLNKNNLKWHKSYSHLCSWLLWLVPGTVVGHREFWGRHLEHGAPWDMERSTEALLDWIGSSADKCINNWKTLKSNILS